MAADDVVGEDLELRLRVHLRLRRQQNGLRFHRAVGLLRAGRDDHLPLEHADGLVVDDRPIELPARSARRRMDDLKGHVGPARTVEQRQSAERDLRLFADHPHEQLPAGKRSARNQREGVEFRALADLRDLAFEVEFRSILDDDRMFQRRAPGERHRRQGVPLDARPGAQECLDKRGARAGAEDDLRPRIERKRALAAHDLQDLDRPVDASALRHLDRTTAQSHRLGERDHRVVSVERVAVPGRVRCAGRQGVAQLFDKAAVEHNQARGAELLASGQRSRRRLDRDPVGSGRQRRRVGHRRAQIRIVPGFDAPRRQAPLDKAPERGARAGGGAGSLCASNCGSGSIRRSCAERHERSSAPHTVSSE